MCNPKRERYGLKNWPCARDTLSETKHPKFTPLSETTSIPVCFICESPQATYTPPQSWGGAGGQFPRNRHRPKLFITSKLCEIGILTSKQTTCDWPKFWKRCLGRFDVIVAVSHVIKDKSSGAPGSSCSRISCDQYKSSRNVSLSSVCQWSGCVCCCGGVWADNRAFVHVWLRKYPVNWSLQENPNSE